jgi:hypothetical protein
MAKRQLRRRYLQTRVLARRKRLVAALSLTIVCALSVTLVAHVNSRKPFGVLVASFTADQPSKEFIYGPGGRILATEEQPSGGGGGGGGCTAPSAATSLSATAASATSVSVSWSASSGTVDHYEVERRNGSGSFAVVATVPAASGTSITDTNAVIGDTAYLYRVRAFADPSGACPSPYSNIDLATTTIFTSDPPASIGSIIYAVHLTRLRTAVNAVRATAGLGAFDWTDFSTPVTAAPAVGGTVLKDQVQKLRNRLNEARSALGLTAQPYTNEPLAVGVTVNAAHILELRQGVQ